MNTSSYSQFETNTYRTELTDFFNSTSLIAKIAFLIIVVFCFMLLLRIGIGIISYFFKPNNRPALISGMVDAKQQIIIPQNPSTAGSHTIYRSINASNGIEFTWSCWVFLDDLTYKSGKYKCVFYKGNDFSAAPAIYDDNIEKNDDNNYEENDERGQKQQNLGLNFPNNAPGLYIAPNTNNMVVIMNTFNVINEEVLIEDIPLNKWMNVVIRCENTTLDVYVNGVIIKSHQLHGVPKQNYGDVFVAPNGGFSGQISNLYYYDYALGASEIANIANDGPNTKITGSTAITKTDANYLSLRWFFAE